MFNPEKADLLAYWQTIMIKVYKIIGLPFEKEIYNILICMRKPLNSSQYIA